MPDLFEWLAAQARNTNQLRIYEGAKNNLRFCPLNTSFHFLGSAFDFFAIRGPSCRRRIGYCLKSNFFERGGVARIQWSNVKVLCFHLGRFSL